MYCIKRPRLEGSLSKVAYSFSCNLDGKESGSMVCALGAGQGGRARAGLDGRAGWLVQPRASASRKDIEEHFFVCSTLLSKPKIMDKLIKKLIGFMNKSYKTK